MLSLTLSHFDHVYTKDVKFTSWHYSNHKTNMLYKRESVKSLVDYIIDLLFLLKLILEIENIFLTRRKIFFFSSTCLNPCAVGEGKRALSNPWNFFYFSEKSWRYFKIYFYVLVTCIKFQDILWFFNIFYVRILIFNNILKNKIILINCFNSFVKQTSYGYF